MSFILLALGILVVFYLLNLWLNSDAFWDNQPISLADKRPKPLPRLLVPRARRNLGQHHNPLSEDGPCEALFEQFDERTWQCIKCRLLFFEKPSESPEPAAPEPSA